MEPVSRSALVLCLLLIPRQNILAGILQPGVLYAISSSASQPREAAKLLRYLISSETIIKNQGLNEGYPSTSGAYQKLYAENRLQGLTLTACMPLLEDRDAFSSSFRPDLLPVQYETIFFLPHRK